MRILLYLWAVPMALFWGWYALSLHDWNFGTPFFSRQVHDLVFAVYGRALGADPAAVPGMIAAASAFDTALVMTILAWGWRASWVPQTAAYVERRAAAVRRRFKPAQDAVTAAPTGPTLPAE
jgi:hypothetical protein